MAGEKTYAIVDIETTGSGLSGNRITEIAIYKVEQGEIIDSYSSLVNPQCPIPQFITRLTGINDAMVSTAPVFEEIAQEIDAFTADCIFVAHSVNFDYPIVKNEFKLLGQQYVRKKLCTVRLSRKVFPGLHSYSLGKLCSSLGIPLQDRHRASGDAHATALLFKKIWRREESGEVIQHFLNARSQEATLPPSLDRESFERLPHAPGVYYFKNAQHQIIYVGKANDLRKRVLGHFYDKSEKEIRLCRQTSYIDHELSGSELLALLMESVAIKAHYPIFNSAQKNNRPSYGLFSYLDQQGILHLAVNRMKKGQHAYKTFYSPTDARLFMEALCTEFALCAKYCHLQEEVAHCSHFRVPTCEGICKGEEQIKSYNSKCKKALESLQSNEANYLIREKGRTAGEQAVIWVCQGNYKGYGFIPVEMDISNLEDLEAFWVLQKSHRESRRILESYMLKNPQNVLETSLKHAEVSSPGLLF